jgi:hypothetical protein
MNTLAVAELYDPVLGDEIVTFVAGQILKYGTNELGKAADAAIAIANATVLSTESQIFDVKCFYDLGELARETGLSSQLAKNIVAVGSDPDGDTHDQAHHMAPQGLNTNTNGRYAQYCRGVLAYYDIALDEGKNGIFLPEYDNTLRWHHGMGHSVEVLKDLWDHLWEAHKNANGNLDTGKSNVRKALDNFRAKFIRS